VLRLLQIITALGKRSFIARRIGVSDKPLFVFSIFSYVLFPFLVGFIVSSNMHRSKITSGKNFKLDTETFICREIEKGE